MPNAAAVWGQRASLSAEVGFLSTPPSFCNTERWSIQGIAHVFSHFGLTSITSLSQTKPDSTVYDTSTGHSSTRIPAVSHAHRFCAFRTVHLLSLRIFHRLSHRFTFENIEEFALKYVEISSGTSALTAADAKVSSRPSDVFCC